jgi:hypothetical protein
MSTNLSGYITQVRYLLHDANANFYTDSQLTDYINAARERIVRDTGALREVIVTQVPCQVVNTINSASPAYPTQWVANTVVTANTFVFSNIFIYQYITGGTSSSTAPAYPQSSANNYSNYPPSTAFADGTATLQYVGNCENIYYGALTNLMGSSPLAPSSGNSVLDIVNINLYWGNTRVPLDYLAWSDFNTRLRFWQNYIGRPLAFSVYGQGQIYIGPVPDQIYQLEIDCVVLPNALVLSAPTVTDVITDPYSTCVKFYAAYLAKFYEQSFGESEIFKQEYLKQATSVLNTTFTRRIPSTYSGMI